jgi:hypothetical protein
MKTARLFALTIIMLTVAVTASAQTKGWGLGAGVFDGDFAADLRKDFYLGGDVSQITGQAGIVARGDVALRVQADYHWLISTSSGGTSRFYPLVGLSFATDFDNAEFGVNLGGGYNFMLTQSTAAFVEAKFTLWGWDGFGIMGGFYF